MTQVLNELVAFLKNRNISEEEIKKIVEEITSAASGKFYAQAMTGLSEEELKELDKIEDESEAQAALKDMVYIKTGKNIDEIIAQNTEAIAEEVYKDARLKYPPESKQNG